jgi:hypothetical protein
MMAFVLNEWKMQYLDTVPDSNRKILRAFQLIFSERPIIVPSLIISVLVVLGFIFPVSSGEKVSLEITVILAISVFQLLVADNGLLRLIQRR